MRCLGKTLKLSFGKTRVIFVPCLELSAYAFHCKRYTLTDTDAHRGKCKLAAIFLQPLPVSDPSTLAAIYTQDDGVVDWRYCLSHKEEANFEVPGTHIGLAFNASVYSIIANRLHFASSR